MGSFVSVLCLDTLVVTQTSAILCTAHVYVCVPCLSHSHKHWKYWSSLWDHFQAVTGEHFAPYTTLCATGTCTANELHVCGCLLLCGFQCRLTDSDIGTVFSRLIPTLLTRLGDVSALASYSMQSVHVLYVEFLVSTFSLHVTSIM